MEEYRTFDDLEFFVNPYTNMRQAYMHFSNGYWIEVMEVIIESEGFYVLTTFYKGILVFMIKLNGEDMTDLMETIQKFMGV